MNHDTNRISRINIKNEKGSFEYKNDKLIINWDKWNNEIFEYFDEYTFYKLDYLKTIEFCKNKEESFKNNFIRLVFCFLFSFPRVKIPFINRQCYR